MKRTITLITFSLLIVLTLIRTLPTLIDPETLVATWGFAISTLTSPQVQNLKSIFNQLVLIAPRIRLQEDVPQFQDFLPLRVPEPSHPWNHLLACLQLGSALRISFDDISFCRYRVIFKISLKYRYRIFFENITRYLIMKYWSILAFQ